MQEAWVHSLSQKDPLEKGKATHSSILAWRILWTIIVNGVTKSWAQLSNFHFTSLHWWLSGKESAYPCRRLRMHGSEKSRGEGNGNPVQYPCLENPMDRGAWQASVHACVFSLSIVSDSLQPYGLEPKRLLCPWHFPGKSTRVIVISFSRGSSWPREQTPISCISCVGRKIPTTALPPWGHKKSQTQQLHNKKYQINASIIM